jgi:hypothetical protein
VVHWPARDTEPLAVVLDHEPASDLRPSPATDCCLSPSPPWNQTRTSLRPLRLSSSHPNAIKVTRPSVDAPAGALGQSGQTIFKPNGTASGEVTLPDPPTKKARRRRRAFDWQTVIPVYGSVTGCAHSVVMPATGATMR